MGDVYRKYIGGLPLHRKHEILDTLLANASRRSPTHSTDLNSLIPSLHQAEIETLAQIVCEGRTFAEWKDVVRDLAEAIIVFRLTHPHMIEAPDAPETDLRGPTDGAGAG